MSAPAVANVELVRASMDLIERDEHQVVSSFEVRYHELEIRQPGDDVVLVLCRMDLRGRERGAETSTRAGTVYELENGLIRRGRVYDDQPGAVSAAEALAGDGGA